MMGKPFESAFESAWQPVRRGALGLAVVAAHVALIVLIAQARLTPDRPAPTAPVIATFLEETTRPLEAARIRDPVMSPVQGVQVAPPEVIVPPQPDDTAISVVAADPRPPAQIADQASAGSAMPAMSHIAYLEEPTPRYPAESRRAREEGLVVLRVLVDERGRVKSIDVYRSSGHPRLDEAARDAVGRALFKPYIDGGVARAASAIIPIEFSLRRSS
jgi:protein TonB